MQGLYSEIVTKVEESFFNKHGEKAKNIQIHHCKFTHKAQIASVQDSLGTWHDCLLTSKGVKKNSWGYSK